MNKKLLSRSLSSIHILYNHTPAAPLRPHPELCCGLIIFHWTEVVTKNENKAPRKFPDASRMNGEGSTQGWGGGRARAERT